VVSLTYRAGVGDPDRFTKSKSVGAFFGLTPKRYQSGETDVTGSITKVGDAAVRTALHDAANALLTRATRFSTLKRWAEVVKVPAAKPLENDRRGWTSPSGGACGEQRWRWPVSLLPCCTACGPTGLSSSRARIRQRPRRHNRRER